jgi:hypothetical protein
MMEGLAPIDGWALAAIFARRQMMLYASSGILPF